MFVKNIKIFEKFKSQCLLFEMKMFIRSIHVLCGDRSTEEDWSRGNIFNMDFNYICCDVKMG